MRIACSEMYGVCPCDYDRVHAPFPGFEPLPDGPSSAGVPVIRHAFLGGPSSFIWIIEKYDLYLSTRNQGLMAERLGRGLQNLVQRFDSASDLTKTALHTAATRFSFYFVIHL